MGAAKAENQYTDHGVLAFDGATGKLLWKHPADDQVFGSAVFQDITEDQVADIFINGRSGVFKAINGSNGELLWEFKYQFEDDPVLQYAKFNFYNSVKIPDQNQDGFHDILTVNGGNVKAAPHSEEDRFPGVLMILDSSSGKILAADTMPDGRESYLSPILFNPSPESNQDPMVIFGTGGETISGNLYLASLKDLMSSNLSNSRRLLSESGHGFIAPPVLVDLNRDGVRDIIAVSHASTISAIDGNTLKILWQQQINGTECSSSFAVGHFNDDPTPDLVTMVSKGTWPESTRAVQVMLDGRTGEIGFMDSLGCVGFSSPGAVDLNGDGFDEAIFSITEYDCEVGVNGNPAEVNHRLVAINFVTNQVIKLDQLQQFKNLFSTPWLGDLDDDGYLDIVHGVYYSPKADMLSFLGMNLRRISTHFKMRNRPYWGTYMGTMGDGVFAESP